MTSLRPTPDAAMLRDIDAFARVLGQDGLHAALEFLNRRTPHRYTGIYRFDAELLRNEALYDRYQPTPKQVGAVPLSVTFCSLVGKQQVPLEVLDATTDAAVRGLIETPVVSYCGVLIRDAQGRPFGTLCHYDTERCQERTTDLPLLEAAASQLYRYLQPSRGA
ncbi:GAF domain-containing protein [Hymenobacter guriensis]|uniref:GAF domain-containing protein n=1 Tax=Hymenobacter guriensis TaxID=2793065 RepID=A0ABS0L6U5_9BACT|nr:GAF domain-containing protein [Hymenobacter guriensis]MBG8555865.1 GAF domain-containing protein [Hymenobacter guriensis]